MNVPNDIIWKIYNKIPLYYLKKSLPNLESLEDYLKFRALELYGADSLKSNYLNSYEKYVQIAAFNGEITKGSEEHIPVKKCYLYAAKANNLTLMKHFADPFHPASGEILIIFQTGNFKAINKTITNSSLRIRITFSNIVEDEIYEEIAKLPSIKIERLNFDNYLVGAILSIESVERLVRLTKTGRVSWEFSNHDIPGILAAAVSILDYKRYKKLAKLFKFKINPLIEYYINDDPDIPEELIDQIDPKLTLFLGCPHIIETYGIIDKNFKTTFPFVPKIPRSRRLRMLKLLTDMPEKSDIIVAALEWWSWIINKESGLQRETTNPILDSVTKNLEYYVYRSGNIKLMKNWIKSSASVGSEIDLVNFPELRDTVIEICTKNPERVAFSVVLKFFTPELYLAIFSQMTETDRFLYLPDERVANEFWNREKFEAMVRKNYSYGEYPIPQFLEVQKWFTSKNIKIWTSWER